MPWTHDFNPRSRKGNDADVVETKTGVGIFQSTFPMQGTTTLHWYQCLVLSISILVPCIGNDEYYCDVMDEKDISIHVPYTGNDITTVVPVELQDISIHVPYTGNDAIQLRIQIRIQHFNPRSLYRERRKAISILGRYRKFQSTFPIQGTTLTVLLKNNLQIFQSTFPIQGTTISGGIIY